MNRRALLSGVSAVAALGITNLNVKASPMIGEEGPELISLYHQLMSLTPEQRMIWAKNILKDEEIDYKVDAAALEYQELTSGPPDFYIRSHNTLSQPSRWDEVHDALLTWFNDHEVLEPSGKWYARFDYIDHAFIGLSDRRDSIMFLWGMDYNFDMKELGQYMAYERFPRNEVNTVTGMWSPSRPDAEKMYVDVWPKLKQQGRENAAG